MPRQSNFLLLLFFYCIPLDQAYEQVNAAPEEAYKRENQHLIADLSGEQVTN